MLLLTLSTGVFAVDIMPDDKKWHFVGGYIIGQELKEHTGLNWWQRLAAMTLVGAIKEFGDSMLGGKWDSKDILAGDIGVSIKW